MNDLNDQLVDFARRLADTPRSGRVDLVNQLLWEAIPSDQVFWTETDLVRGHALVRGLDPSYDDRTAQAIGQLGMTHPAIESYVAAPSDLRPRRVSDVADSSTWLASPIYSEAFSDFGAANQLSVLVSLRPGVGRGWTMTRSGSDFTGRDLELARRLQGVLVALDGVDALCTRTPAARADSVLLTPREGQLVEDLAAGLTAAAIGRRRGITERTVRKHLDSIYRKLGCGDRLLAVERARSLGLLTERGGAPQR